MAVQDVDYDKLKKRLLADGQRLVYEPKDAPASGIAVKTLPGIVQDDIDAKIIGDWMESTTRQPFIGSRYLHDDNTGKGKKSIAFTIPLTAPGTYEVRLAYSQDDNRAKNVPVKIGTKIVHVDQTQTPPIDKLFISLGTFSFSKEAVITVSNEGTTGHVIVDAVQLIKK